MRREIGVLISLIAVALGFQIFSGGKFIDASNWGNILTFSAELGVVALGATILMIAGEFDLSVGSNFAVAGMVFGLLTIKMGWKSLPAFFVVLCVSSAIGMINAAITLTARIPSFITTLGALLFWRGMVLAVSEGWPLSQVEEPSKLMRLLAGPLSENFSRSMLWWLVLGALAFVLLRKTVLGNWIFAVGGNEKAARAVGVPVTRVKFLAFVIAAALAGFAGVMQFSRLESFSPTYGEGIELEAIAASVIGGTLLTGGVGSIFGTLLSSVLIGMISSGLVLSGAPVYWFRAFVGVILIFAVILNRFISQAAESR